MISLGGGLHCLSALYMFISQYSEAIIRPRSGLLNSYVYRLSKHFYWTISLTSPCESRSAVIWHWQVLVRCLLCEVRAAPPLLVGIMTSLPARARPSGTAVAVATQTTSCRRSRAGATVALWWTRSNTNHACRTCVSLVYFYAER